MKNDDGKHSKYIPEGSEIENLVEQFLDNYSESHNLYNARELAATIIKMLEEDVSEEEWRIARIALKEMRHSYRVFSKFRNKRKVTVFGSARSKPDSPEYQMARDFTRKISQHNYMVITGAGPGIMQAGNEGAGKDNSFGLNIEIPWEQKANQYIDGDEKLINYHFFFTRKLFFIKESHALALFPGGYGTLDEAFETLVLIQAGKSPIKPIVMVDSPRINYWTKWLRYMQTSQLKNGYINTEDLYLWNITYDVNEATRIIREFYRNYHSQRWFHGKMMFRLNRKLINRELDELRSDFSDIVVDGVIEQREAVPEEAEGDGVIPFPELPRLLFTFDRASFGRMRQMIDRINSFR